MILFCHTAQMFLLGYVVKSLSGHTEGSTETVAGGGTWIMDSEDTLSRPLPGLHRRASAMGQGDIHQDESPENLLD